MSEKEPESGRQENVPARRSPRDLAEHLWGAWPGRGEMWPFEAGWPFREVGRGGGLPRDTVSRAVGEPADAESRADDGKSESNADPGVGQAQICGGLCFLHSNLL